MEKYVKYEFDIFDSDEFQNIIQNIILEEEEIDDIEKEESYQYTIQFIVYDNDSTKIDIDSILKKMDYFFSSSPVIDHFHINENYMEFINQTSFFIHFFMVDHYTLSRLINFFKCLMNICTQDMVTIIMNDKDGNEIINLSKKHFIGWDFLKIFSCVTKIKETFNENIYNYLQKLVKCKRFNKGKYVTNLLSCLKLYKSKMLVD